MGAGMTFPLYDASGAATVAGGLNSGYDPNSGTDSSGWLTGLGALFSGVGNAVSSGLRASNTPTPAFNTGWIFNPATQQYYNAATGQALTSTGSLTSGGIFTGSSSNMLILVAIGVVALLLFMKKG